MQRIKHYALALVPDPVGQRAADRATDAELRSAGHLFL